MAQGATVRLLNPAPGPVGVASNPRRRRRRKNAAPTVKYVYRANPRHRRKKATTTHHRRRRRNPPPFLTATVRNPRRRRNPGTGGSFWNQMVGAFKVALPVALGAYGARYIPALVLKEKDKGLVGYGANLGTGVGISAGARAMGARNAAPLMLAGAALAVIFRGLVDFGQRAGVPAVSFNDYVRNTRPISQGLGFPVEPIRRALPQYNGLNPALRDYIAKRYLGR